MIGAAMVEARVVGLGRLTLSHRERMVMGAYSTDLNDPAAAQIERAETQLYQLAENADAGSWLSAAG